ncbi:MAG TPA: MBL fold metallo-hydrolase [Propionibacteriaceae bacterium]|nr:MBL fold metallo-hydrolase [Propionibacteriaceae bacterium]
MKIKVFFAADGDCLLLTSADGHHVLVDGGRTRSFEQHTRPVLQDLVDSGHAIDLVVVSHIDADHISGVISLLKDVSAWAVYDYQIGEGRNPTFPQPARPRPPEIKGLWHNSWRAQLRDLAGPITAFAGRVSAAMELVPTAATNLPASAQGVLASVTDLAESIADGVNLLKLVEDETPIPHNAGFGKLVLLRDPMHVESVGATTLKVIGPMEQHLRRLRAEWQKWLEHQLGAVQPQPDPVVGAGISGRHLAGGELTTAFGLSIDEAESVLASIAAATEILEKTDAARVTPPNRASITLLAEENGKTCLLTGDAAEDELLAGLAAAGCFPDGAAFRCDVLRSNTTAPSTT